MTDIGPKGASYSREKGFFESTPAEEQKGAKGQALADKVERFSEQSQRDWFRMVMMFAIPLGAVLWTLFVAYLIVCGRVEKLPVALPLGVISAGILTIFGLQIGWAYKTKESPSDHALATALKLIVKTSRQE